MNREARIELEVERRHAQRGSTLLEFLIAMSIFSIASAGIFSALQSITETAILSEAAPALYERDQVVRYEISWVLDDLQRNLIAISEEKVCTKPWISLVESQGEFKYRPAIVIGEPGDLKKYSYAQDVLAEFERAKRVTLAAKVHASYELLAKALLRCRRDNLSVTSQTMDIKANSSLYLCGYGKDLLVEIKVVFWDYLEGKALHCNGQNEKPGRGLQVLYKIYQLEPFAKKGKKGYKVKSYIGRMFIPKKVQEQQNRFL